jgi:hypothetical protein
LNYEDEDYVRYYTRDTVSWKALGWEGQTVLSLMLHGKFDRSGVFDCDSHTLSQAVTLVTGLPKEVADIGLKRLLDSRTWIHRDGKLVWPKFIHAQTCRRSDRLRQRESREKRQKKSLGGDVTGGDICHESHNRSQDVTPSLAEQSRAEQNQAEQNQSAGAERLGLEYATECPPNLVDLCRDSGLVATLAKKLAVTPEDVEAAISGYSEYFTVGGGFGQKRTKWGACVRARVTDLKNAHRLAGLGAKNSPTKPDETGGYGARSEWQV